MIRKTFEHEIQQVKDEVLLLGSMVEHAIITSVEVLKKRDIKGAEKIYSEELLNGGSALGTEKDYDGDGDKEYPYESLKEQIDRAK